MIDDSNTVSLLHFDGTDASTVLIDESGKTWTRAGDAQIDTAQYKFGGSSGLFDGTGDYWDTPDSADFDVGSGDFTIDCWIKRAAVGAEHRIAGQMDATPTNTTIATFIYVLNTNVLAGGIYTSSTAKSCASVGTIDTNWHHVAMVRNGNTIKLYIDGTNDGSVDVTGVTVNNSAAKFAVGRHGEYNTNLFNGWIDEFRFTKGLARWTTNFIPPTAPYGRIAQAVIF